MFTIFLFLANPSASEATKPGEPVAKSVRSKSSDNSASDSQHVTGIESSNQAQFAGEGAIPGGLAPPMPGGPPPPGGAVPAGSLPLPVIPPGEKCPECIIKDAFKRFLQAHNKSYPSEYEEANRLKFFQEGLSKIKELNSRIRQAGDAMFGQTKFTDSPFAEFVKKFTGAIKELNPAEKFDIDIGTMVAGVPQKFDWRDEGVVPNIRYQKECGSCYAFSTSDLTTMQWAIDHSQKNPELLAPQYILDCIHDPSAFGCDGGRPYLVLQSNANCTGSSCAWPRETCYPYQNANMTCKELACRQSDKPNIQVSSA